MGWRAVFHGNFYHDRRFDSGEFNWCLGPNPDAPPPTDDDPDPKPGIFKERG
jgi:hypothetical protein